MNMSEHSGGNMDSPDTDKIIVEEDILKLLSHYVKHSHRVKASDIKGETIMERCKLLFTKDYKFSIVPNLNGELCAHYPTKLIITEFERDFNSSTENVESRYNCHMVSQLMKNARCARCWSRFVIPVIFYQGKHICRSATLSGGAEMFGRSTTEYLLSSQNAPPSHELGKSDMFAKFRGHDIQLLKFFDVGYICDLMVEKKKTKFGLPVSSSEKVDKENRYSDFDILGMPYPGCEFFKDWKDNSYVGETVMYDWGSSLNDSSLDLPSSHLVNDLGINWSKYTEWSLIELTQNYMKLLLQYIKHGSSGLLIHCISGWDRTPLFISLLRLSMWADGVVHKSLSAMEILYLTLGYDWYLFGHDLSDRLSNEQEVMYFCFKMLKDIASEEFSLCSSTAIGNPSSAEKRPQAQHQHSVQRQPSSSCQAGLNPRVDSESSFGVQGVLLADDLMNFTSKGSNGSLNSIGSNESPDQITFTLGTHEEEEEKILPGLQRASELSTPHRRSLSPVNRVTSSGRHSSPVTVGRHRRRSSESQQLSIQSNYFVGSPVVKSSSPVSVPQRVEERAGGATSYPNSIGSWQIISSSDNLRGLAGAGSSNSHSSGAGQSSHVSSCHEAVDINISSLRWQRLDAVSRLFNAAYGQSVQSHMKNHSSGMGLASFFDRFAEQVGLRGQPKPQAGSRSHQTGV